MEATKLSEKAKGKQRAVEAESHKPTKELCIRFTEGFPDLTLQIGEQHCVRDIKTLACSTTLRTQNAVVY